MSYNRLFARHPITLEVEMRDGPEWVKLVTTDVSRQGVGLRTNRPAGLDRIVQLRVNLPQGERFEAMGRVRRVARHQADGSPTSGMGVEFFSMSEKDRDLWDTFIFDLVKRSQPAASGYVENSQLLRDALPPEQMRQLMRRMRLEGDPLPRGQAGPAASSAAAAEAGARRAGPEEPVVMPAAPPPRFVSIRPGSIERLGDLAVRCRDAATIFARTATVCVVGQPIDVAIIHPETDAEFILHGRVERLVTATDGAYAGIQVRLPKLGGSGRTAFERFVATGHAGNKPSAQAAARVARLRAATERTPRSAAAHAELAWALLIDEQAAEVAVKSFLAALALNDQFAPAHCGLALAYALAGDQARALAFGGVARDLETFED